MNLVTFSLTLHLLSAVIWVGGMFFAYTCLRPVAATQLEPPERLMLWVATFNRFFPFVWLAVLFLPLTGYLMIFSMWGSMGATPLYVHIMNGLGIVMILIYLHVYFAPFKRLKEAVVTQNWPEGGKHLNMIRQLIKINLSIGLVVIIVASAGEAFH